VFTLKARGIIISRRKNYFGFLSIVREARRIEYLAKKDTPQRKEIAQRAKMSNNRLHVFFSARNRENAALK